MSQTVEDTSGSTVPTDPYAGMTPEHEALIRRLHAMESHPDYKYTHISLAGVLPEGVTLEIRPLIRPDSGWMLNEDFNSQTQSDPGSPATGFTFEASVKALK